jgi:hypothetical protein
MILVIPWGGANWEFDRREGLGSMSQSRDHYESYGWTAAVVSSSEASSSGASTDGKDRYGHPTTAPTEMAGRPRRQAVRPGDIRVPARDRITIDCISTVFIVSSDSCSQRTSRLCRSPECRHELHRNAVVAPHRSMRGFRVLVTSEPGINGRISWPATMALGNATIQILE